VKKRWCLAGALLLACDAAPTRLSPAPPARAPAPPGIADAARTDRKVFATYLPWYEARPGWDHWKWLDHDPENVVAGRRQIAAAHYPRIGPYDSRDDAVMGHHLMLLAAAGVDGVFINWYGRGNRLDEVTRALFDRTAAWRASYALPFSLALMLDAEPYLGLPAADRTGALAADLADVLFSLAGRPEYQRLEGKPVVLWFPKPDPGDAAKPALTPAALQEVRKGQIVPFWLGVEHPDPTYRESADLAYGWIAGVDGDGTDYGKTYLDWLYPTFAARRKEGWELPVGIGVAYPGFDDGGVYAWSHDRTRRRRIDRSIGGTPTLDRTWDALESYERTGGSPVNWLQVATFNDWNEGSEIEPSQEHGTAALGIVARRARAFKKQAVPDAATLEFAWRCADNYLERRRAGRSDQDLAPALHRYFAGAYAEALAIMER